MNLPSGGGRQRRDEGPEEVDASRVPEAADESSSPDEIIEAPRPGVPVSREEFERLKSEAAAHEQLAQEDERDGE